MKRIYVAGPLGPNDDERRARLDAALAAGASLVQAGLAPFVPHLWPAAMHADGLAPYEAWMAYDFAWLDACDAVLRIPGHSPGADREVARARAAGLPVFSSIGEVVVWAEGA